MAELTYGAPSVNDDEYQILYGECYRVYLEKERSLRKHDDIPFGCRISALLYVLFCLLWNKNREASDPIFGRTKRINIRKFLGNIKTIIDLDSLAMPNTELNGIFFKNQLVGHCVVFTETHVDRLIDYVAFNEQSYFKMPYHFSLFDAVFTDYPVAIFGIVTDTNRVIHYFTIRKDETGYHLVSSYGSINVQIKQYETLLDVGHFFAYIHELSVQPRNRMVIHEFMKKYFLNGAHAIKGVESIDTEIDDNYGDKMYEVICLLGAIDIMRRDLEPITAGFRTKRKHLYRMRRNKTQTKQRTHRRFKAQVTKQKHRNHR